MSPRRTDPAAQDAACVRDWPHAYERLREADGRGELDARGLVRLAQSARWSVRTREVVDPLERAHAAFVAAGELAAAARTALDLVFANQDLGQKAVAASWWARAEELLAGLPEGPEHGLHRWHRAREAGGRGDLDAQEEEARQAHAIARRHADRDVEALALVELGHVAAARGEDEAALETFERATGLALGGAIGLLESGLVFCNAIWACRSRGEWSRALEWTDSATRWIVREQIGYFPSLCRVHRAEVLRVQGRLVEAEDEAREALRLMEDAIPRWLVLAWGELGEIRRRRGDLVGAMEAFRAALELGWDPEPGLALCLAAQGDVEAGRRALERLFLAPLPTQLCQDRANLLLARVILEARAGHREAAEGAALELEGLASRGTNRWDAAAAATARGVLELELGREADAVEPLLRARRVWSELDAPFELAGSCAALGRALVGDGDAAGGRLALEAARETFERIGALHERGEVERLLAGAGAPPSPGPAAPPELEHAELRREGEAWAFLLGGARPLRLRDSRGLHHLAVLLEYPGLEHAALELAGGGGAGRVDRGDGGELLDAEARAAYRRRLEELDEELAEAEHHADLGRGERLAEEKEALVRALAGAVGLGGRARRAPGAEERARQSVTKALRGVLRRVEAEDPALGRLLTRCVRTGRTCAYVPDPDRPVRWRVTR